MWQSDPQLQALIRAAVAEGPHTPMSKGDSVGPAYKAFAQYVQANRQRLGIPDGYYPDIKTGGTTLKDQSIPWLKEALIGGGMVAAPFLLGALGAGGAAQSATSSVIPGTGIPVESGTAGLAGALPMAPTAASAASQVAGTTAAGTSALDKLRQSLTSSQGVASLAALLPTLIAASKAGGGGNGSGANPNDLSRIQGITEARMRRADPLHQVAVQLAFQRAPIAARNGITLQDVPLPQ